MSFLQHASHATCLPLLGCSLVTVLRLWWICFSPTPFGMRSAPRMLPNDVSLSKGKHSLHVSLRRYTCGRVPHPQHQYKAPDMPLLNPSGPATSSLVISTCSPQLSTHSPRTPAPGASFPRTNLSSAYRSILLSHLPPIPLVPFPYPSRFPVICVEAAAKYLCQIYVSRRREPPQPHSHRAPQGPRAGSLVRLQP